MWRINFCPRYPEGRLCRNINWQLSKWIEDRRYERERERESVCVCVSKSQELVAAIYLYKRLKHLCCKKKMCIYISVENFLCVCAYLEHWIYLLWYMCVCRCILKIVCVSVWPLVCWKLCMCLWVSWKLHVHLNLWKMYFEYLYVCCVNVLNVYAFECVCILWVYWKLCVWLCIC